MNWINEIDELHQFFEQWFLGADVEFERLEAALTPDFTIVSPDGSVTGRAETLDWLRGAHGTDDDLRMATTDHRLLHESDTVLVASYVETHVRGERIHRRLSTVVFARDADADNGLRWVRVHETWLERPGG